MKAMILAAGEGTRLRPLTLSCPKAMLPIQGIPLVSRTIMWLQRHSITQIAINLHHLPDHIVQYLGQGDAYGVEITYSLEEDLLGTAGGVRKIGRSYFDETFAVIYGDVLTDCDLTSMLQFHRLKAGIATVGLFVTDRPEQCGIVELDERSLVRRFVEKPQEGDVFGNLANGGIYIMEPEVLDYIPQHTFFDFGRDVFPILLRRQLPIYGYHLAGQVLDIGTMEKYRQAQEIVEAAQ